MNGALTVRIAGVALALALGGRPGPAAATDCLDCHGTDVDPKRFEASPHAAVGCSGCHEAITEFPHPDAPAKPDCAGCLDEAPTKSVVPSM